MKRRRRRSRPTPPRFDPTPISEGVWRVERMQGVLTEQICRLQGTVAGAKGKIAPTSKEAGPKPGNPPGPHDPVAPFDPWYLQSAVKEATKEIGAVADQLHRLATKVYRARDKFERVASLTIYAGRKFPGLRVIPARKRRPRVAKNGS